MKEVSRCYYFKNGRLDLSVLEETCLCKSEHIEEMSIPGSKEAQIYMDDSIASIFEEMGNYFMVEEKDNKNT